MFKHLLIALAFVANTATAAGLITSYQADHVIDDHRVAFSGFTWDVQEGVSAPGPNTWIKSNVELTDKGLRFWLRPSASVPWAGAYAITEELVSYGTITVTLEANFDAMDDAVVISPYLYPTSYVGVDGTNEIDIVELSRWGHRGAPLLNFTQWPQTYGVRPMTMTGQVAPGTKTLTVTLTWKPNQITYQASTGAQMVVTDPMYLSKKAMQLYFNIRYFRSTPANPNAKPFSVTITHIKYTRQ